ncbi:MAG: NAD(P)-dependent oxidoreductase [Sphingomonadales bacterium]
MKRFKTMDGGNPLAAADIAQNFDDLHPPLSAAQAVVESARCLYCYDAPCVNACPTGIDIPRFIHQIRSGNLDGSARTILSANIMGGTCARACPTEVLCEEVCVVHHSEGGPVKIGELQRHAVDHLLAAAGPHPFQRAAASGKTLAVIGAGPAGLAFAHRAAVLGHDVVVYDAKAKAGGLNEYGLAAYKMAGDFAQREVAFLLEIGGIEVKTGEIAHWQELRQSHDAVFIGAGLPATRRLNIAGEDLSGVRDALDFIEELRRADDKANGASVPADVVVIGGGNTAIDAALQARCLGARRVTLAYRRGPENMSATRWEQELASTNGVIMRYHAVPKAFIGDTAVEAVDFGDERVAASLVLKAIGQMLPDQAFDGLKREGGKLWVDEHYQTSVAGVYAGGDCIARGQDLTVQAVEDGKRAAEAADRWLRGAMA